MKSSSVVPCGRSPVVRVSPPYEMTISRRTLGHYDKHAEDFWQGTRDHDVSQNMNALLAAITAGLATLYAAQALL